ncbi:MAG: hypothetical protein HY865_00970 [Chloroflexi bacterium]|nr:hypothetical protein [Chloroflexota bacterium]
MSETTRLLISSSFTIAAFVLVMILQPRIHRTLPPLTDCRGAESLAQAMGMTFIILSPMLIVAVFVFDPQAIENMKQWWFSFLQYMEQTHHNCGMCL